MSKINKLKTMCGLPRNYTPTSHCFADSTHQTCCRISENKRRVTDGTGNPIGTPSDNAYSFLTIKNQHIPKKLNKYLKKTKKRSWCTCIGSNVCSNYGIDDRQEKIQYPTHIAFINVIGTDDIIVNVPIECEDYVKTKLNYPQHLTPDVVNRKFKCPPKKMKKIIRKNLKTNKQTYFFNGEPVKQNNNKKSQKRKNKSRRN